MPLSFPFLLKTPFFIISWGIMKKSLYIISGIIAGILCACSSQQSTRDGVSFANVKTFYVEAPKNAAEVFGKFAEVADYNKIIAEEIAKNLESKGFVRVPDRDAADAVFAPSWDVSTTPATQPEEALINAPNNQINSRVFQGSKFGANLEIEAFLKNDSRWAWRGRSPIETNSRNVTTATLKNQVVWALEEFPPEKYGRPSVPILEIFQGAAVTESEIENRQKEIQQKQLQEQQQAAERAKQKLAKEGQPNAQPTKEQIQAEYKKQSVSDIEKSFQNSLEKKQSAK